MKRPTGQLGGEGRASSTEVLAQSIHLWGARIVATIEVLGYRIQFLKQKHPKFAATEENTTSTTCTKFRWVTPIARFTWCTKYLWLGVMEGPSIGKTTGNPLCPTDHLAGDSFFLAAASFFNCLTWLSASAAFSWSALCFSRSSSIAT